MQNKLTLALLITSGLLFIISIINVFKGNVEAATTGLLFACINLIFINLNSIGGALDEQKKERQSSAGSDS